MKSASRSGENYQDFYPKKLAHGESIVNITALNKCRAELYHQFKRFQNLIARLPSHLDSHHNMHSSSQFVNNLASQPSDRPTIPLPPNVLVGSNSVINYDERCFARFRSLANPALIVGANCTMDYVHFALGETARVEIGDYCYFTSVILLCEQEICIGNYVVLGWNTTIADTDFHPIAPAERIADAIAISPLGKGRPRPALMRQPVIIEDDVWVGPNVTILKGVRIGAGAWIEAGALVTRDVPPRSRVMGNPAQIIGEVG